MLNRPSNPLFARRAISAQRADTHGVGALRRILGPRALTALGVGGIVGSGIFATIGVTAHDKAGPAITLSLLVASAACICVALCYCECASTIPVAGSAYAYAFATFGELGAWLTGWNLAACYLLAGAGVAQAWSHYAQSLLGSFGILFPAIIGGSPIDVNPATGAFASTGVLFDFPAALALSVITVIVYRGIRLSLKFNNVILVIKMAIILFVIFVGLAHAQPQNWSPFAPFGYGGFSLSGLWSAMTGRGSATTVGMLAGAATVFFAFGGFEILSVYSEECQNPRRDVPIGVIATIAIVTLLYIGVAAAITGMAPYSQISVRAPVAEAFGHAGMPWAQMLVAAGAVAGMTSVLLVVVMSLPRVLMAIGRDGLLPHDFFGAIHDRFRTPYKGVMFVGVVAIILASILPLRMLMDVVMMATLAGYVAVCLMVLILRRLNPVQDPPFRAPFGPAVPVLGTIVCLVLMLSLPPVNWVRLGAYWLVGLAVYFGYGRRHRVDGAQG